MIWDSTYKDIAVYLDLMVSDPPNAHIYVYNMWHLIGDITSQEEDGSFVVIKMLPVIKRLWEETLTSATYYDIYIRQTIKFMNRLTTTYYNSDLSEWVNSLSWTDGCVPYNFSMYSEDMGYDISSWPVCPSS